jgi:hypothetical protein
MAVCGTWWWLAGRRVRRLIADRGYHANRFHSFRWSAVEFAPGIIGSGSVQLPREGGASRPRRRALVEAAAR